MDSKDKAKELMNRIYKEVYSNFSKKGTLHTRKQCALICVEEKIETAREIFEDFRLGFAGMKPAGHDIEKWYVFKELQEVKQEIEKL